MPDVKIGSVKISRDEPKIVAVIKGEEELARQAEESGADIIEVRVDLYELYAVATIREKLEKIKSVTKLPILATIRRIEEGGMFMGKEGERKEIFKGIFDKIDAVDIELNAHEIVDDVLEEALRHHVTTILSHHDYYNTAPYDDLKSVVGKALTKESDIFKIATRANRSEDVIALLRVLLEHTRRSSDRLMTAISLGGIGSISRIAFPFFGSCITYGFIDEANAPGQLSVSHVKKIMDEFKYKIPEIRKSLEGAATDSIPVKA